MRGGGGGAWGPRTHKRGRLGPPSDVTRCQNTQETLHFLRFLWGYLKVPFDISAIYISTNDKSTFRLK